MNVYEERKCYFVCNLDKEILIDIEDINSEGYEHVILDEKNILVPKKNQSVWCNDHRQHLRIENGKLTLIHTFEAVMKNWTNSPRTSDMLLKNKMVIYKGQLYNFETGMFAGEKYAEIILPTDTYKLDDLARYWKLPSKDEKRNFIKNVKNKMKQENLLGGYKHLEEEKEISTFSDSKIKFYYDTFVFLHPNGEVASDVYYLDEIEFKSIPVVNEDGVSAYDILQKQLEEKIEKKLQENKEKEKIYSKIMDKMLPTKNDKN